MDMWPLERVGERPENPKALEAWLASGEAPQVVEIVKNSGLYPAIASTSTIGYDKPLVSAFVERYYAETDSMHFHFGEMTITPDDAHEITGLSIEGKSVRSIGFTKDMDFLKDVEGAPTDSAFAKDLHWDLIYAFTEAKLGWNKAKTNTEMWSGKQRSKTFQLKSLRDQFMGTLRLHEERKLDPKRVTATATAYILYILGSVIFPDTSGSRVNATYVQFLADLDRLNEISWGTACLAFLLNEMRKASRAKKDQIGGSMPLLQVIHVPSFVVIQRL